MLVEAAGVALVACVAVAAVVFAICPVVLAPAELVSACWGVTALFELRFCHTEAWIDDPAPLTEETISLSLIALGRLAD